MQAMKKKLIKNSEYHQSFHVSEFSISRALASNEFEMFSIHIVKRTWHIVCSSLTLLVLPEKISVIIAVKTHTPKRDTHSIHSLAERMSLNKMGPIHFLLLHICPLEYQFSAQIQLHDDRTTQKNI